MNHLKCEPPSLGWIIKKKNAIIVDFKAIADRNCLMSIWPVSNGDNLTKLIDWSPRTPVSRYLMSRINSIHLLLAFWPLSNSQSEITNVELLPN